MSICIFQKKTKTKLPRINHLKKQQHLNELITFSIQDHFFDQNNIA